MVSNGRVWTIRRHEDIIAQVTIHPVPGLPGVVELDGEVAPEQRRKGLGSRLLQRLIHDLACSQVQQLSYAANSLDSPAARFLQAHGFFVEHEEWLMALTNLQERSWAAAMVPLHSDLIVKPLSPVTFCQLYEESFAGAPWYQPYTPAEVATTLSPSDDLWGLWRGDTAVGFAWVQYHLPEWVEIEPVGIVKTFQGQGYGRYLLRTLLRHIQAQGINQIRLGVWSDNHVAVHLYRQFGFQHIRTRTYLAYNL